MKNIQEYINKIEQISKKDENVRFMPVRKSQIEDKVNKMEGLEDYKEIKDMVSDWESELDNVGRDLAPVPIPVRTKDK
jgi:hypothetical protein